MLLIESETLLIKPSPIFYFNTSRGNFVLMRVRDTFGCEWQVAYVWIITTSICLPETLGLKSSSGS
jgi:hypothetical protein